jgi:DinB family protein
MNAIDVLRSTYTTSRMVLKSYVSDLSDADLMKRPHPECNHLAWQLGHLIASECLFIEQLSPGHAFALPEGFAEQYSREAQSDNDASHFLSRDEYLSLLDQAQEATFNAMDNTTEAQLDEDGPEMFRPMFPTKGAVWVIVATHNMMHAGQFVPVRRASGKDVVI